MSEAGKKQRRDKSRKQVIDEEPMAEDEEVKEDEMVRK